VSENIICSVELDEITQELSKMFDYEFTGETSFRVPSFTIPSEFSMGLIVGGSGTGKSTLLNKIGKQKEVLWGSRTAVCSSFGDKQSALSRLGAVGLNSVPAWMKPYHVLSNGEKFRADLARKLEDNAVIDEFTSVVDRDVAKSCAFSVQKYIREKKLKSIVFASCHYDIIDWLQPDWVFDTNSGNFVGRGLERHPTITVEVLPASTRAWEAFKHHHYLSGDINKSSRCWIAVLNGKLIGFASVLAYPSGTVKNAWRGHRTVILPEFQGLGIGVRLSDAIASMVTSTGARYFSKTASVRMGEYRNNSSKWKPTSKNMKARPDYASGRVSKEEKYKHKHASRVCYSHEYIGLPDNLLITEAVDKQHTSIEVVL
jgi:GNAT superfamily N-acetyltransferase/ABC-type ATPase involved in cell division